MDAGRAGEQAATGLTESLQRLGFETGRLKKDHSVKNGINLWIVADPLRKGAATNTVQILEALINLNN